MDKAQKTLFNGLIQERNDFKLASKIRRKYLAKNP